MIVDRRRDEKRPCRTLNFCRRTIACLTTRHMKNLTIAFLAAASLFSVSACKKKGGDVGAAMAKMEEFKTNMCKCTDAACATKVTEDMTKWSQEFAKTASKDQKIDEATTKKMTELTMAMSERSE